MEKRMGPRKKALQLKNIFGMRNLITIDILELHSTIFSSGRDSPFACKRDAPTLC
jgi:hypothetical protein